MMEMSVFLSPQNRIQESMNLFSAICNNVFFRNTSMVRNSPSNVLEGGAEDVDTQT